MLVPTIFGVTGLVNGYSPSGLIRLTNHPDRDDYPLWHSDGKHILTVSERDGETDLYLFDVPAKE